MGNDANARERRRDGGRRGRGAFLKVFADIATHPRTRGAWERPTDRGYLVGVLLLAISRQADRDGDELDLREADVAAVTGMRAPGCWRAFDAFLGRLIEDVEDAPGGERPILECIAAVTKGHVCNVPSLRPVAHRVARRNTPCQRRIRCTNLAKVHGFLSPETETETETEKNKKPEGPKRAPSVQFGLGIGAPEFDQVLPEAAKWLRPLDHGLTGEFFAALAASNRLAIPNLDPAVAMAFVVVKWPTIVEWMRKKRRNDVRAQVRGFWGRIDRADLDAAREYLKAAREAAAEAADIARIEASERVPPPAAEPASTPSRPRALRMRVAPGVVREVGS